MDSISIYQGLFILLALTLFSRTLFMFLQGKKGGREVILAAIVWGGLIFVLSNLALVQKITNYLGFKYASNAALFLSVVSLLFICLKLYIKSTKSEQSLTRLVRALAIKDLIHDSLPENTKSNQKK